MGLLCSFLTIFLKIYQFYLILAVLTISQLRCDQYLAGMLSDKLFYERNHFYQKLGGNCRVAFTIFRHFCSSFTSVWKTITSIMLMCNVGFKHISDHFYPKLPNSTRKNIGSRLNAEYSWMGDNFFTSWKHYWMLLVHCVKKKCPSSKNVPRSLLHQTLQYR